MHRGKQEDNAAISFFLCHPALLTRSSGCRELPSDAAGANAEQRPSLPVPARQLELCLCTGAQTEWQNSQLRLQAVLGKMVVINLDSLEQTRSLCHSNRY